MSPIKRQMGMTQRMIQTIPLPLGNVLLCKPKNSGTVSKQLHDQRGQSFQQKPSGKDTKENRCISGSMADKR
jgi:hypothetical protein